MIKGKSVIKFLATSLLYSSIVCLVDFLIIYFYLGDLNQIQESLSFVMLLEGGIGLTAGGAAVFYSPMGAKISEVLFHSKPWNAKRQIETEKHALVWIGTGIFLVFSALLVSAV